MEKKKLVFKKLFLLIFLSLLVCVVKGQDNPLDILFPSSNQGVYGQWPIISERYIRIVAYDMALRNDVNMVTFYYSANANDWIFIGTDTDPSLEPPTEEETGVVSGYSGWNVIWDANELEEGKYHIQATMSYFSGEPCQAIREVYFTPTPPKPEIITPTYIEEINEGFFEVSATTSNLSVISMDVDILIGSDKKVDQSGFKKFGTAIDVWGHKLGSKGFCTPSATAQAIWRLAGKNSDLLKVREKTIAGINKGKSIYGLTDPNDKFIQDEKLTFNGLTLLLATKMSTSEKGLTSTGNGVTGVLKFLRDQELNCDDPNGYWVRRWSCRKRMKPRLIHKDYQAELARGESLVVTLREWLDSGKDEIPGNYDDNFGIGHDVAGKDTVVAPKKQASFFDANLLGLPIPERDWTDNDSTAGGWSTIIWGESTKKAITDMLSISPKTEDNLPPDIKGSWIPMGTDDPNDGSWSVTCYCSNVNDGFYLVRARMTDSIGNWGKDFTTVYINNQAPLPPVELTASIQNDGTIKLSWNLPPEEPGYDIYGYEIYRDRGFGFELITPEVIQEMFYIDSDLEPNTQYHQYEVLSLDFSGSESEFSLPIIYDGKAALPSPAHGAEGVNPIIALSWLPAFSAVSHDVYFGTNFEDVNNADHASDEFICNQNANNYYDPNGYDLDDLELETTYYWRIDEVNDPNTLNVWKGDVWDFTVRNWELVDDFESYINNKDLKETWQENEDVCLEKTIACDDNSIKIMYYSTSPYYWQTARTFNPAQDWTARDIKALDLWFYGDEHNEGGYMYVELEDSADDSARVICPDPNLQSEFWQVWPIRLQDFSDNGIDLTSVKKISIGLDNGSSPAGNGVVYFDDIRLYPLRCVPEHRPTGDITGDCVVDSEDLMIMALDWLLTDYSTDNNEPIYHPLLSPANIYDKEQKGAKIVNFRDYAILADEWLKTLLWP